MKKIILTLTLAACSIFAINANAITLVDANYRDIDKFLPAIVLDAQNDSYTGVFDLTTAGDDGDGRDILGFDGTLHKVVDAVIGFVFLEDSDTVRVVNHSFFQIGQDFLSNGGNDQNAAPAEYEVVFNSASFSSLTASIFLDIEDDGRLVWSVELDSPAQGPSSDTLTLFSAYLGVVAENRAVPDSGSTAAMLGFIVFGMAAARSRRNS